MLSVFSSAVLRLERMDAGSMDDDDDDDDDSSVIDSEGWSQIPDASNKRKNRDSESDDNITEVGGINKTRKMEVEYKVIVAFSGIVENINNPMKLMKIIKKSIGNIKSARYLSNNRILLFCVDKKQQEIALMIKELGGTAVKCHVPGELDNLKGVIMGVPVSSSDEVLKAQITNETVTEVKRLPFSRNGKSTVVLTFNCKNLPERIKIGYVCYTVRPYVRPALRCFNCQRLGHVAAVCKGKRRCCKCGGDHDYGQCGEGVEPKCCNCGGPHSAAFLGCKAQKQATEAMKLKQYRIYHMLKQSSKYKLIMEI